MTWSTGMEVFMSDLQPERQLLESTVAPIAADTTLLLAASSFVAAASKRQDPRADLAFDAVATAFCNGAELFLPLPKKSAEKIPIFLELWTSAGFTAVPNLEPDDESFSQIIEELHPSIAQFLNGMPSQTARWIQFQFTPDVVDNVSRRSDVEAIQRAGPVAAKLVAGGSLDALRDELLKLESNEGFREPPVYTWLMERSELGSFINLCVAYAISVSIRGYSYALNLAQLEPVPVYRHHWVRIPVVGESQLLFRGLEPFEQSVWFPWGAILAKVFDPDRPLAPRDKNQVSEVLQSLRRSSSEFRRQLASHPAGERPIPHARVSDEEVLVLDTLSKAGISPLYSDSTQAESLAKLLRTLVSSYAKPFKLPVEWLTSHLQPTWLRKPEAELRKKFRRDTFWDVFADPGIKAALRSLPHG
jgi:hypothetical protein